MGERLTLLTLLGATDVGAAARRWPRSVFLPGLGLVAGGDDAEDYEPLVGYLDEVLRFVAVRPGAAADRVGLVAEVVIEEHPAPPPLVLRQLPDVGFVLLPNPSERPARLFVTQADTGVEVVVEGLPVEIRLPNGLLTPLRSEQDEASGPSLVDLVQGGPFEPGRYDSFEVVLSELGSSVLRVHLRVRLTEEREVIVEPAVPISIGPCRFSGLPCRGVHDLGLLPYPTLSGSHTEDEQALEWARHQILGGLGVEGTGLITVRTLDLDHTRDPLRGLVQRFADQSAGLEFVLEDLALPVSTWLTPVPTHGRFGLRRAVLLGGDQAEAYDLSLAPAEISLAGGQLRIFRLLFETPDTVIARMAVLFGDSIEQDHALVLDISDGWLLQGAWLPPNPIHLFTLANARVDLMTTKVGILLRDLTHAQGAGWADHFRVLVDFGITGVEGQDEIVLWDIPKPPGNVGADLVVRDVGWDLGSWRILPSFWFPEGIKLHAFEVIQLEIEELAFLTEDNGGHYVAVSGGISVFPGAGGPNRTTLFAGAPGVPAEGQGHGGGLRFRRLRLRIAGNELAPRWLLDGISLFLKVGRFEVSGFGSITDVTRDGHRYREFGLGVLFRFDALGKSFSIGAQLFYGRVTGPVDRFTYWLFGLQLGYLPVAAFDLREIRMLAAGGMLPDLAEPTGRAQEMRLLEWYRQNRAAGAVEVRSDRSQQRGGWRVQRGAMAAGMGADLMLSVSDAVFLRIFLFFADGDDGAALLIAAEVFALSAPQPVGVGAVEVDLNSDKWNALVGVDLDLATLLDADNALTRGLGRLTGTIFAGNRPAMFAIGQVADQASWLTLATSTSLIGLRARVSAAFCLQIVSGAGPRAAGLAVTAVAEGSMGIGKVQFYAAFGLLAGTWGNAASSSGFLAWAEVALRIKVFWVFSFGASVKAAIEQLGPQQPNYRRISLEVRIGTPWWLPDVTFRVERVHELAHPEAMPVLSAPLRSAAALEPGLRTATPVASTALGPAGAVHPVAELRALPAAQIPNATWSRLTPVSVDSTLALDFAVAVGNDTVVVPSTPPDAGRQAATPPAQNQLSATYTILQLGVRRRARFGPAAGVWTDLLAPEDSAVGGLDELLADPDLAVTFASALRLRWDADVVVEDAIQPRRLLVNADTPYSFVTGDPATEEGLLAADPAFPCCTGKRSAPLHVLDFTGVPIGVRADRAQRFSDSTSTLRWLLTRPPVVAGALGPPAGVPVARLVFTSATDLAVATVTFDEPAFSVEILAFWRPVQVAHLDSALVVEAGYGLEVMDRQVFPLAAAAPTGPIRCQDGRGFTWLTLRYLRTITGTGTTEPSGEWLEVRRLHYRTVREERDRLADQGRCQAIGGVAGGGKLAWLPNHDYELAMTIQTAVDYQGNAQEAVVVQRAGFRTSGLPGLNAVEVTGEELEGYVESIYPGALPALLYRSEPVVLAFDERFNSLLPVDREPAADDIAERTQLLEWVLVVEQGDGQRLSVPTADWVVAHRGTPPPLPPWVPWVIDDVLVHAAVRTAPARDPFVQRLERLERLSPACHGSDLRLHPSQLLSHAPVDPDPAAADTPLWPARTTMRVAVRGKASPYVARHPFTDGDQTALTAADEGLVTATEWQILDGRLGLPDGVAGGLRRYAVLGDDDWNHLRIRAELHPGGGAAGVAVAVGGLPRVNQALLAVVDEAAGTLTLLARRAGVTQELADAALPTGSAPPYSLEVLAFDDQVRARVGEITVQAARGNLRDGRVAVVSDGHGACAALHVDGLDAYASQLETSRYAGFAEHVTSWDGVVHVLPGDGSAVPGLLAGTAVELAELLVADADPQLRQRLFDRWVADLVLPLASRVDGVRLSVLEEAGNGRLLVLESPEPLPFSRDVRLNVTHRVISVPVQPIEIPRPLLRFAAGLDFTGTGVRGPVLDEVADLVEQARGLVRATRSRGNRVEYHIYQVQVAIILGRRMLDGELLAVQLNPPVTPTIPPRPLNIPPDHVLLLDAMGRPLTPAALPLPVEHDEVIELAVLTNSREDKALLIPAAPLPTDTYTFTFRLDRPRYRAAVPDEASNYRAEASLRVAL